MNEPDSPRSDDEDGEVEEAARSLDVVAQALDALDADDLDAAEALADALAPADRGESQEAPDSSVVGSDDGEPPTVGD